MNSWDWIVEVNGKNYNFKSTQERKWNQIDNGSVLIKWQHVFLIMCMIMPISGQYTDVYGVIICYITEHLDPTNYLLHFGIIALHELRPRVILRFTLKNIRNNLKQSWTQLLEGETLEDLFDGVYGAVEIHKLDVW